MTVTHIEGGSIAAAAIMGVFGILLPIAAVIIWKKKTHQPLKPVICGAGVFLIFALVLEAIPKYFLFISKNPVSEAVNSSPLLFTVAGALLAGVFEETGRFAAFRTVLKEHTDRRTAVSYGIGHGGFEAILVLGVLGIEGVAFAMMVNSGQFETLLAQTAAASPEKAETLANIPVTISGWDIPYALMCCAERVGAMAIQTALSMLVFRAVREKGKGWLLAVSIILHALIDVPAALYQFGILPLPAVEVVFLLTAAAVWAVVYRLVYLKLPAGE